MSRNPSARPYDGPIRAVIADLAGTTVDFGSCAPAGVFVELFRRRGFAISLSEARGPMGIHKRDHIRALISLPHVWEEWRHRYGRNWTDEDIHSLYQEFIPLQLDVLPRFSELVPGTVATARYLESRGVPLAVTTGYNRAMLEVVLSSCQESGFTPAVSVCADDVPRGRPAPWMIFRAMELLGAFPPDAVVCIGDTLADVESGRNAGVWTVGVTSTGNLVGMTREEFERLDAAEATALCDCARAALEKAGCHYAVRGIGDLPAVLEEIEKRVASHEQP